MWVVSLFLEIEQSNLNHPAHDFNPGTNIRSIFVVVVIVISGLQWPVNIRFTNTLKWIKPDYPSQFILATDKPLRQSIWLSFKQLFTVLNIVTVRNILMTFSCKLTSTGWYKYRQHKLGSWSLPTSHQLFTGELITLCRKYLICVCLFTWTSMHIPNVYAYIYNYIQKYLV